MNAIAKVSNPNQSRFEDDEGHSSDWSMDSGTFENGQYRLRFTIVTPWQDQQMTILSEITIIADDRYSQRQRRFDDADLEWIGHAVLAEHLFEFGSRYDMRIWLDSTLPQENRGTIYDEKRNARLDIQTSVRKL